MTDESGGATRNAVWAGLAIALFFGLPLGAIAATSGLNSLDGTMVASAAGAVTIAVLAQIFKRRVPEDDTSRERVREAERGLEEALRAASTVGRATSSNGDGCEVNEREVPADVAPGFLPVPPAWALADLWAVTHRRLDLYHDIAMRQARQSFRNAQAAMGIGFILLVTFVAVALQASTTAGAVVAGGLGAVSAALAGFVSRTFVRSQETAAGHLRAYFDQPLEFSRYLAAERLIMEAGLTEGQRKEAVTALVQALVAGPGGGAAPADASAQQPQA